MTIKVPRHLSACLLLASSACFGTGGRSSGFVTSSDDVPFAAATSVPGSGGGSSGTGTTPGSLGTGTTPDPTSTATPDPGSTATPAPQDANQPTAAASPNCVPSIPVTPLQRLTQQQFANSVAALLRLPTTAITLSMLPQDESVGPFAVNTQAAVGDLAADQYQTAAIAYSAQAMANLTALLPCKPASLTAACTQQFITQFGQRAFRRPLTSTEVARYATLTTGHAANDPNSIRVIIQAFLQSPYFLYRPEFGDPNTTVAGVANLTSYERATRLSFFLWNAAPDDTLLQAAASNQLQDAAGLQTQVDRLIADARYPSSVGTYVSQWLGIASFAGVQKDPSAYPQYAPALQSALLQETQDFVAYVLAQDATLNTLLTSSETVPTSALLSYYGVTNPTNQGAISLSAAHRGGILTRGAFLAIHGHSNASAPVPRGRIVRENMLCQTMPAPPPGVSTVPPAPKPGSTTRQLLLGHESNASCAACHVLMDHIGFGFEHFDGVGAWRDTDSGQTLDVTGDISGAPAASASFNGAVELSTRLATIPNVSHCAVLQMYRYGLARPDVTADACSVSMLSASFDASHGDLRALMRSLAQAPAFLQLRVTP